MLYVEERAGDAAVWHLRYPVMKAFDEPPHDQATACGLRDSDSGLRCFSLRSTPIDICSRCLASFGIDAEDIACQLAYEHAIEGLFPYSERIPGDRSRGDEPSDSPAENHERHLSLRQWARWILETETKGGQPPADKSPTRVYLTARQIPILRHLDESQVALSPQMWAAIQFWRGHDMITDEHIFTSIMLATPRACAFLSVDALRAAQELLSQSEGKAGLDGPVLAPFGYRSLNGALDAAGSWEGKQPCEPWHFIYGTLRRSFEKTGDFTSAGRDFGAGTGVVEFLTQLQGDDPRAPLKLRRGSMDRILDLVRYSRDSISGGASSIDELGLAFVLDGKRVSVRVTAGYRSAQIADGASLRSYEVSLLGALEGLGLVRWDDIFAFEDLINSESATEQDIQRFLEKHRAFLKLWPWQDVFPQVHLGSAKSGLRPDFLLVNRDLQRATLLELKLPKHRLLVGLQPYRRLSATVTAACKQLAVYRDWFRSPTNRRWLARKVDLEVYEPHLALVVGRRPSFSNAAEAQAARADARGVDIFTYDDLANAARQVAVNCGWTQDCPG